MTSACARLHVCSSDVLHCWQDNWWQIAQGFLDFAGYLQHLPKPYFGQMHMKQRPTLLCMLSWPSACEFMC